MLSVVAPRCDKIRRWDLRPGLPGDYILHIDDLPSRQRVIIAARVSSYTQDHAGNLDIQLRFLRQEVAHRRAIVVHEIGEVGSGFDPNWLHYPALLARDLGAVIVAETVDRLMRPSAYHSVMNPCARLSCMDLDMLQRAAPGVQLYTVVHPDATPGENRAAQTRRGQGAKSKGGRPINSRSRFRERWLPVAVELRSEGMSLRAIAHEITRRSGRCITQTTIHNWLKMAEQTFDPRRP